MSGDYIVNDNNDNDFCCRVQLPVDNENMIHRILYDERYIDDEIDSICSDIGLLDDIDFHFPLLLTSNQHSLSLDDATISTGIETKIIPQQQQVDNDQQNIQSSTLSFQKEWDELQLKLQKRQTYIQQELIRCNNQTYNKKYLYGQLLQQIQHRETISCSLQQQQLLSRNGMDQSEYIDQNITNSGCNNISRLRSIYELLLFEYYMTIPACIILFFHCIFMMTIYDFILECIRFLYTDSIPLIYKSIIYMTQRITIPSKLSILILPSIGNYTQTISNLISSYQHWSLLIDILFYVTLGTCGLILLHYSGYLYWWLSDYDYTILKFDVHNRIRLVLGSPTATLSSTSSLVSSSSFNPLHQSSTTTRSHNVHDQHQYESSSDNAMNINIRRLHSIHKRPILRLTIYMFGYFITYMLTQTFLSMIYPYFSQHNTIVRHLPSKTFEKDLYTIHGSYDKDSIILLSEQHSTQSNSILFPCIAQSCQNEIIRQLHANIELISIEQQYTKQQLAMSSYHGFWSTWSYHFGETIPLLHPFTTTYDSTDDNYNDDDDDEYGIDDVDVEENDENVDGSSRNQDKQMIDFDSTPVFNYTGEIAFAIVFVTMGIVTLRIYGFIFWEKY